MSAGDLFDEGAGVAVPAAPSVPAGELDAVAFTVYGSPRTAGSKRAFAVRKGGKRIDGKMVGGTFTGRVAVSDDNPKSAGWKDKVAQVAGEVMAGRPVMEGPVMLGLRFYLLRPKGHVGKRGLRPKAPAFHTIKPDVLKLARAVEDALSKVVYRDDSQIVDYDRLGKRYGSPERVEVTVRRATAAEIAEARAGE